LLTDNHLAPFADIYGFSMLGVKGNITHFAFI